MPSTHKKVIVRKMDRDSVSGYVSPAQFVNEGKLELLNTAGNVVAMDLREIKGVYFVREFGDSESLTRKTFTSRPRSEGLWVRLRFKDNEILEGLMPSDLTQSTAGRFSGESSRPALEYAANFCTADCAGVVDRTGGDRRQRGGHGVARSAISGRCRCSKSDRLHSTLIPRESTGKRGSVRPWFRSR